MARAACHHHCGRVDPGGSRTKGNAMSLRITAAGAIAFAALSFLTVPASACDERYIQKCERAARAWLPAQPAGLFQPRPASCTAGFRFCRNCARTIYVFTRKNTPCMIRYWVFWRDPEPTRDETRQRNLRDREPHDRRVSTEARLHWQGLLRSRSQLRTVRNEAEDHPAGRCDHHGLTFLTASPHCLRITAG